MRLRPNPGWLDPAEWQRDGRGRSWGFSVSTDAIIQALESVSGTLADPLDVLACERITDGQLSKSVFSERPISGLAFDAPSQYFIRSRSISPVLPALEPLTGIGWPGVFATNGLVLLDHPFPSKATPKGSNLGIVQRVHNLRSGELREHSEYDRIFSLLKRTLTKVGK